MVERHEQMTVAEARRALYVDFEGPKGRPPVLLGVLRRQLRQQVVDADFRSLDPEYASLVDAVRSVVRRAQKGDRRIVSWSTHDLDKVQELGDTEPELVAAFEACWVNGLRLAERWAARTTGIVRPGRSTLAAYEDLISFAVPASAEAGHVGETVRRLRPRFQSGQAATLNQSGRWRDLLEHNAYDCRGLRAICVRAADDIEAQDRRSGR